jgi:hypothetical protein
MTAETGIENTSTSQINISPKGSRKASPSRIETIPLIAARLSQLPCMVSLKSTKTAASSIASLFDLLQSSCTVISSSGYNLGCLIDRRRQRHVFRIKAPPFLCELAPHFFGVAHVLDVVWYVLSDVLLFQFCGFAF